jgi:hypothetical protein
MTIQTYRQQIQAIIPTISCHAPEGTILRKAGETVNAMVRGYVEDGALFLRQGDPVNAIAAFGYAEGWLEGGILLGLVSASIASIPVTLGETPDPMHLVRLEEKVYRYRRLLREGITAVEPAPEEGSVLRGGCEEILAQAQAALWRGTDQCSAGNLIDALCQFGYGHGWLDSGARTGLFRIIGRRELFTI